MSDFTINFDPDRGDLIYGRDVDRTFYMSHPELSPRQQQACNDGSFITVDRYNNLSFHQPQVIDLSQSELEIDANVRRAIPGPLSPAAHYWVSLREHKHSPGKVHNVSDAKLAKEARHYESGNPRDVNNLRSLSIRRACKFGIHYIVTNYPNAIIHFILDNLDVRIVLSKETTSRPPTFNQPIQPERVPVTSSELRSVFREWHEYKDRVYFYANGVIIPPPWHEPDNYMDVDDENDLLYGTISWKSYARERFVKYQNQLDQRYDSLTDVNKAVVDTARRRANHRFARNTIADINRAANTLKNARDQVAGPQPMDRG